MGYFILGTKILEGSEEKTWVEIHSKCLASGAKDMALGLRFNVDKSKFRTGTLDTLMGLTDILSKLDINLEGVLRKVEKQLEELDDKWEIRIDTMAGRVAVDKYLKDFVWEDSKFPRSKSLNEIVNIINDKMNSMDNDLKKQMFEYTDTRNTLNILNKKLEGSYQTRDLFEIIYEARVGKESFVESDYLTTCIAILNKNQVKVWEQNYEQNIEENVVPRSSKFLGVQDKDGTQLWKVILFKSVQQSFIHQAKSKFKIQVRPFVYDETTYIEEKKQRSELTERKRQLETQLKKTCDIVFSELYISMIHLKTVRVYVESVLRWGLPPKYFACIVRPNPGREKYVLQQLIKTFAESSDLGVYGSKEDLGEQEDYYPFVIMHIGMP